MVENKRQQADGRRLSRIRRTVVAIAIPVLVFLLLRFPMLTHHPGIQDEQWFAVPGLTVWQEGIPRIPYVPTRARSTFFENADRCLMALPPGLFYLQAPFFGIFEPGYPTGRIPLFLGAIVAIVLSYFVVRWLGGSRFAAGCGALLIAASRPLLFVGLVARPDLLCVLCGLGAMMVLWQSPRHERLRPWLIAGALCGLSALFHPFALVFAIQAGVAALAARGSWKRAVGRVAALAGAAIGVASLWLPLIAMYPYEFRAQFFANVLDRAGPGLPERLLWPFPALAHHTDAFLGYAGPWQAGLFVVGLLGGTVVLWRRRTGDIGFYLGAAWSSIYLTATVAGIHPTRGYWMYAFLLVIPLLVVGIETAIGSLRLSGTRFREPLIRHAVFTVTMGGILLLLVPGGGLRTTWIYWTHWKDPRFHAPTFIAGVLEELPAEGTYYADLVYVFDLYLSGRETRLCQEREQYWGGGELSYRYLLLSWEGDDAGWASQYDGEFVRRFGSRDLPQSCFVDLYQPTDRNE